MGTQTPEQRLDNEIKLWAGMNDFIVFHTNVGKIKFYDEKQGMYRWFDTGLPPGWPDLMILSNDGKVSFCETKVRPRKPTPQQLKTIALLNSRGFKAFVAYSLEEFIENMKGE